MHIKPISLWLAHLHPSKIKPCLWRIGMAALLSTPVLAMAAPNDAEALQGHWRLEQAGRAENGQLVAHDFNQCRLLRTYTVLVKLRRTLLSENFHTPMGSSHCWLYAAV